MSSKHSAKSRSIPAADAGAADAPRQGGLDFFSQHSRTILIGILLLGALLRIVYLVSIQGNPDYNLPTGDAAYKHFWARAILTGDASPAPGQPDPELATSPYVRPPAYPFFLAFVYLMTGYSFTAVRVIQMIFGLISCWLLYRLGRRLFSEPVSLLAALLMSTYWFFIFFEAELNSPALIVFLILAILNLMEDWRETASLKKLFWASVAFGVLVLDRPETLLFLPALMLWAFVTSGITPPARRLLQVAIIPLVIGLCILPVTLRNYVRSGEPVLICTIGGLNLYAGNNPEATGYFPDLDYGQLFGVSQTLSHQNFPQLVKALERKTGQENLTQSDVEDFFIHEATKFMRENPEQTFALGLKKIAYFWGPNEISSDKVFELEKAESPLLRMLPPFWLYMPLAVLGAVSFIASIFVPRLRKHLSATAWQPAALILAFVVIVTLTHVIFFVVARFRAPVIPFVLLFSAFGIVQFIEAVRLRDTRLFSAYSGLLALSALIFFVPWVPYQASAPMFHFQRGLAYGHQGQIGLAVQELLAATKEGGESSPDICSELGFALVVQGEVDNGIFWYQKALQADPNHALTLRRMADALVAQGKAPEASAYFARAVEANFTDFDTRLAYARVLLRLGRVEEAQAVADETEELAPGSYHAHVIFGDVAAQRGDNEASLRHIEAALALKPNDATLHTSRGLVLASLARYEDAIAAYRQAIALAPGNSLPHTNLGNLYAHMGQFDNAIVHYMDALIINNDDVGAEYGWGYVDAQRGDRTRAIERMRRALVKRPDYLEATNYIGYLYMQEDRLGDARFYLERAVQLNPNFLAARVNLGDLYTRLNLHADAEVQYQTAAALAPGDAAIAQALAQAQRRRIESQVRTNEGEKVLIFPGASQ